LRRLLCSAERLSDSATARGLRRVNTPCSKSSALLVRMTRADHLRVAVPAIPKLEATRVPGFVARPTGTKLARLAGLEGQMTSHVLHHYPERAELSRWVMVGILSGAASVLVFHQGAAALLNALELSGHAPYSTQPTSPWGVPQVWSITFWGGLWGALLAATLARLEGAPLLLGALAFGAVLPTLVAWFVVAPLKGQPMAGGLVPMAMAVALVVNGAWGLGTGIGLALFGRPRARPPR
jgi:hypothetical protein